MTYWRIVRANGAVFADFHGVEVRFDRAEEAESWCMAGERIEEVDDDAGQPASPDSAAD